MGAMTLLQWTSSANTCAFNKSSLSPPIQANYLTYFLQIHKLIWKQNQYVFVWW